MADGRHVGKYSKCHNSPTNGPTGMQLGWSYLIMCPTCPPWCGYHGNGRCLATAHWIFCSHGSLEAERVNQFWWNLVCNSKLGPQWQPWDERLNFFKIQNGGRSLLESIRNAITRLQITDWDATWVVLSITFSILEMLWLILRWDRLGRLLGGCVQATPLLQNRFLGICSLLLTAQWTFWFYGVYRSKTATIFIKLG